MYSMSLMGHGNCAILGALQLNRLFGGDIIREYQTGEGSYVKICTSHIEEREI